MKDGLVSFFCPAPARVSSPPPRQQGMKGLETPEITGKLSLRASITVALPKHHTCSVRGMATESERSAFRLPGSNPHGRGRGSRGEPPAQRERPQGPLWLLEQRAVRASGLGCLSAPVARGPAAALTVRLPHNSYGISWGALGAAQACLSMVRRRAACCRSRFSLAVLQRVVGGV